MPDIPQYLPLFAPDALIIPETGKQDKIEMDVEAWSAFADNKGEANYIFQRIGPPPPVSRTSRLRQDHGDAYGWIFNTTNTNSWQPKRKSDIRLSPLMIERAGSEPRIIPPPLFAGACEWVAEESGHGEHIALSGKLKLILNPTRFVRHNLTPRELPERLKQFPLLAAPHNERAYDKESDNWLPLYGRLYASLTPAGWRRRVFDYLTAVEDAFEQELSRVCESNGIVCQRMTKKNYNIKVVETYWEWYSPNPLMIVENLIPYLRTFSRRFQNERTYEPTESINKEGVRIIQIQTAPGEWLKIYAKTNLRIRIEVTHKFRKGKDTFQFPREPDAQGVTHRTKAHTFSSIPRVQDFFGRLQRQAAKVVNEFLRHIGRHAEIAPSHISAYHALFNMTRAIPTDYPTALFLLSLLMHEGGIRAGGDEATCRGIDALRAFGIIEPTGRGMYLPTAPYRHAFQMLRDHGSFPLLTERKTRVRRRIPPPTE